MRIRLTWAAVVLAGVYLGSPAVARQEGETKPAAGDTKAADKQLFDALRDVINTGRDLFNKQGDYSGCYRVFQGSLLTAKPLLTHRPDLQKAIDKGLADAEQLSYTHQRAFALRKVLDAVRSGLKTGEAVAEVPEKIGLPMPKVEKIGKAGKIGKVEDTRPEDVEKKNGDANKGDEKKQEAEKAGVTGRVMYKGKPLPAGTVTFNQAKNQYAAKIQPDGTYELKALPPGAYDIAIETASAKKSKEDPPSPFVAIPAQYADPLRSGLTAELKAGKNVLNFELN